MRVRVGFCEEEDYRIIQAVKNLEGRNWLELSLITDREVRALEPKLTVLNALDPTAPISAYQEGAYLAGLNKLREKEIDILIAGASIALAQFLRYVFQTFSSKRQESLLFSLAPIYWKTTKRAFSLVDPCVVVDPSPEELAYMAHQAMIITEELIDDPIYACVLAHATAMENDKMTLHRATIQHLIELTSPSLVCSHPLQLDAAMSEEAGRKKLGELPHAPNVLVCPDITSANLLYKSMEVFSRDSVMLCGAMLVGLPYGFVGLLPRTVQVAEIVRLVDNIVRVFRSTKLRDSGT
jgi:phosphotransacetylase